MALIKISKAQAHDESTEYLVLSFPFRRYHFCQWPLYFEIRVTSCIVLFEYLDIVSLKLKFTKCKMCLCPGSQFIGGLAICRAHSLFIILDPAFENTAFEMYLAELRNIYHVCLRYIYRPSWKRSDTHLARRFCQFGQAKLLSTWPLNEVERDCFP